MLGLKARDSQVLGLKVQVSTVSFKQGQFQVAQGGLELRESSAQRVLGLEVCATTAWPLRLTSGWALHSDLQESFIC